MGKYFSIDELVQSETADRKKIDNAPDYEALGNLELLITYLDGIREEWHSPIIVTSGYRCPELNKAVGGSLTSSHQFGLAADIVPKNGKFKEFKEFIVDYLKRNNISFDQCIIEKSKSSEWVHFSPVRRDGAKRKMIFKITK